MNSKSLSTLSDSRGTSIATVPKLFIRTPEKRPSPEFSLDGFLNSISFSQLSELDKESLTTKLEEIDALALLNAVQAIAREIAMLKIENHFITDFLERNDPKLLIGVKQRRLTAQAHRRSGTQASMQSPTSAQPTSTRMSMRPSIATTHSGLTSSSFMQSGLKKSMLDFRLNYRAKAEMAEKTAMDVEQRIAHMEAKAMYKIKMLNTRIEEMRYSCAETRETLKNFELHFLKEERDLVFLENATDRQLERKFRKFVDDWLKNGRALLSTMRLRINSLLESCQQHRNDLITKADLSGILSAVDFEQLQIKRNQQLVILEEKNKHLHGLKSVTGKASLAMSQEKKNMSDIELESRRITNKTYDVTKAISKLEREAHTVELQNMKDVNHLNNLQSKFEQYEAPSITEYIERKAELVALEKEEKLIQRKFNIVQMKVNNYLKRLKHRDDGTEMSSLL